MYLHFIYENPNYFKPIENCYIKPNHVYFDDFNHSHKKRKDSLDGSLAPVLFATKLEFLKIIVTMLPQNTSNVNIESTAK